MIPHLAVGAASLMGSLILATGVARWWARTTPATTPARHRAGLVRPMEALTQREQWCLAEHRPTLHVQFALGGAMCLDCRTQLTGGTR
ncbi:hypothetical protein [Streptomyces sp. NPDC059597]|uniref:hypothetical protein n=1 Tax=Streptomyces sp. NPDC059597 TaxID=3346879 RepID=UPI0036C65CE6